MTKGSKKRLIERIKSLLIVLLSCSAVFLVLRTQASIAGSGERQEAYAAGESGPASTEDPGAMARPLRMAAAIQRGSEVVRYGVQYDQAGTDELYQQAYSLLVEALSSAGEPREISEEAWRQALSSAPGLYFDWQGEIPLAVLNGWLSVDNQTLAGTVRRMVLTAVEGRVLLYSWDESAGQGWACPCDVISAGRLAEAVGALQENGAIFAFEGEDYLSLSPYTMVLLQPPVPAVYSASNPVAGEDSLRALQETLGFPENSVSYTAAGELVLRSRNDTLHMAEDGQVSYEAAAEGSDRYRLAGTGVYEAVVRIAAEAELKFRDRSLRHQEAGGPAVPVQVRLDRDGWAARFLVEQGQITEFQLRFRSYADSGTTSVVLPERQAMAAMEAKGHGGEELLLVYLDSGEELVSASWAAARALDRGR